MTRSRPTEDTGMRRARRALSAAVSVVALLGAGASLAATPAQAATTSPWWNLTAAARPTNLVGSPGKDEIQELTVSATAGEYVVYDLEKEEPAFLPFDADAATLREKLNSFYGSPSRKGVVVTEANPEPDTRVFTIDYPSQSAPVPFVFSAGGFFGGTPLSGGTASATIAETQVGEPTETEIVLSAENIGNAATAGQVTLTDQLPTGLEAVSIAGKAGGQQGTDRGPVTCSLSTLTCTFAESAGALPPFEEIEVKIGVVVLPGAHAGEVDSATVSGGGAAEPQSAAQVLQTGSPRRFGVESFKLLPEAFGGKPTTQAASHPFQVTGSLVLDTKDREPGENHAPRTAALPKTVVAELPAGMVGNPTPFAQCTDAQFAEQAATASEGGEVPITNNCPADSAVGVATVTVNEPRVTHLATLTVPIFNMEPHPGEPARFAFKVLGIIPVFLDASIRSGSDYGIDLTSENITQIANVLSAKLTFFGTPGDRRHDHQRGWECLQEFGSCPQTKVEHPPAFLLMPTSCEAPFQATLQARSWGSSALAAETAEPLGYRLPQALDGCNRVPFSPTIHAEPTSDAATSPTGLNFDLNFNDPGLTDSESVAQSEVKRAVVTLPVGFTTNPSVAEGLKACSQAEYDASSLDGSAGCTPESKIGDVEIESPLASEKVLGSLYVATQRQNPYDNLLTIYLVAHNAKLGVLIKQALKVTPNPLTGQLTTEVDNIPQLPFSRFHLSFRQGQRSPLITPPACGTYTVTAALYPYSNPTVPIEDQSSFQITQGPEGQGCPSGNTPPVHPELEAGSANPSAGAFSPFTTEITRRDSEQEITHFSIKLPPGVAGKLAGVSECSDGAIALAKSREVEGGGSVEENNPSCPKNSEVGHSLVGSGVGNVLAYAPGKLYLAGPYHGSNISLVSITAAKVGPFDLGTVVVRFALKIDPETAEVSVDGATSDPIPHIVDGIPVHLRDIRAYVDRPNFSYNPTSCAKKSTASTILGSGLDFASSADDQPVTVTSPFQAADCASLGFKPSLALSLKGGTKRGSTPAFKAVVTYPKKGAYANIAKSVVTLPHSEFLEQSHIKTICTRAQFKEGKIPGEKCPAASIYGKATAITPLLDEPLKGPVYLRSSSHNLPDLVAALHNKQVDFALDGRIDSVKGGRIRNTFETVPDAPVSKFVLEMQGGKKGLLVNSTNLCAHTNRAISEFTGQNGKLHNTNPVLSAKCGGKGKKAHKGHR